MEDILGRTRPIGVFDSGVGGISVLKKLKERLPFESFVYYSDSKNAPYGKLTEYAILGFTDKAVGTLFSLGCKAVVIACNTATAVAAESLRMKYPFPIIGLEPALRPAEAEFPEGRILLLATPVTLRGGKFKKLFNEIERGNVTCVSAPELVGFVETGRGNSVEAVAYLKSLLDNVDNDRCDNGTLGTDRFDACVLGCTHFPFAKAAISEALGYEVKFFDGADGAAKRLEAELKARSILNFSDENGVVLWNEIYPSGLQLKLFDDEI